jgi:putative transcriptional regulator
VKFIASAQESTIKMFNHVANNQFLKMPQPQIGLLIRQLRQEMQLTQEEFASHCGVVFSTVNRWEKGRVHPSPMALNLIQVKLEKIGDRGQELLQKYANKSP